MKTEDLKNNKEYKYGFTTDIENIRAPKGLNEDTIKLDEGMRFIIGRNSYTIGLIENIYPKNILTIFFEIDEINKDSDDLINGIADLDDGNNDSPSNPW